MIPFRSHLHPIRIVSAVNQTDGCTPSVITPLSQPKKTKKRVGLWMLLLAVAWGSWLVLS